MARPSTGANLSIAQLENILNDHKSSLSRLEKQRKDLLRKLDAIDRSIEKIGGWPPVSVARAARATTTPRAFPKPSTKSSRTAGKPMKVADITKAVLATGYRSTSDSFRADRQPNPHQEERKIVLTVAGERGTYQLKK